MPKTKIVIVVEGGLIQGITSDSDGVEVCVLDFDCDGDTDAPEIVTFYSGMKERCNIHEKPAELSKQFVNYYFKELKKVGE